MPILVLRPPRDYTTERDVFVAGEFLSLTAIELARGRAFSSNTIDVHVSQAAVQAAAGVQIQTIRGAGYRMAPSSQLAVLTTDVGDATREDDLEMREGLWVRCGLPHLRRLPRRPSWSTVMLR
jgi:hypothetical protein